MDKIVLTELGISKNGKRVLVWIGSHAAATHIKDEPSIEALLTEVPPSKVLIWDYLQYHRHDREIGVINCVATDRTDDIVWANAPVEMATRSLLKAVSLSRQVQFLNRSFEKLDKSSHKLVISTWIGEADSPSFPDNSRENARK